ncbi:hypothetical protein BRD56_02525 [Thermoplasmatales archaeon SW_10_69_26]|nr:MAG: hypothetical protein BRD56_02525 [Thermoplasmatales archaeon SW_10_69_26]
MTVTGSAVERRTVPASRRVYAPTDWQGDPIHVLVPDGDYTIHVDVDEDQVTVTADVAYEHTATPWGGTGPPQLYIAKGLEGEEAILVRDPSD